MSGNGGFGKRQISSSALNVRLNSKTLGINEENEIEGLVLNPLQRRSWRSLRRTFDKRAFVFQLFYPLPHELNTTPT